MSLEPIHAPFRCWDHGDCLEHPELALACADGSRTALAMFTVFVEPDALSQMTSDQCVGGWGGSGTGGGYEYEDREDGSDGREFPFSEDPSDWEAWLSSGGGHIDGDGHWLSAMTDYEHALWSDLMLRVP